MAGEVHLKEAANNLRRAASDLKVDINMVRQTLNDHHNQTNKAIDDMSRQLKELEAMAADPNRNDVERGALRQQAHEIQQHINDRKRLFNQEQSQLEQQIRAKESNIQALNSEAHTVERKASTGL